MRRIFVRLSEASLQTPTRLHLSNVCLTEQPATPEAYWMTYLRGSYDEATVALKVSESGQDQEEIKVQFSQARQLLLLMLFICR